MLISSGPLGNLAGKKKTLKHKALEGGTKWHKGI
jgi:hypothetical protein